MFVYVPVCVCIYLFSSISLYICLQSLPYAFICINNYAFIYVLCVFPPSAPFPWIFAGGRCASSRDAAKSARKDRRAGDKWPPVLPQQISKPELPPMTWCDAWACGRLVVSDRNSWKKKYLHTFISIYSKEKNIIKGKKKRWKINVLELETRSFHLIYRLDSLRIFSSSYYFLHNMT